MGSGQVTALAGGVGGAKLAHGLALTGLDERLRVVVNTADDFRRYGLHVSPDLDTVMYTLAEIANTETGWGIAGDSYVTLEMIGGYGRDTWFWLGDKDFATHILRTDGLHNGRRLTEITADLAGALGIAAGILPMCDEPVQTMVETPDGLLDFQEYFVRRGHQDDVLGVRFDGVESAAVPAEVDAALAGSWCVVLCPSNPIVSIDPILSVPGMRDRLGELPVPVVAVSPIVGGQAIKGPAAQMLQTLGHETTAVGIARLYRDFLTGMVLDRQDEALAARVEELGIATYVTNTVMQSDDDRRVLAAETLEFARQLSGERAAGS